MTLKEEINISLHFLEFLAKHIKIQKDIVEKNENPSELDMSLLYDYLEQFEELREETCKRLLKLFSQEKESDVPDLVYRRWYNQLK